MGGNALKEYGVERLSKEDFYSFQKWLEVDLRMNRFVSDRDYYFIKSYGDKDSFGDMDVLINKKDGTGTKLIERYLRGRTYKQNSNCYSALYEWRGKRFQVDFIAEKDKNFDFASHYFDYNDLGNLIGRVAHKAGLKFGHDGLWYILRDGDYKVGNILLTNSFHKAIYFLGFSPLEYSYGFDSLESIFRFVADNPYFDPESYNLENRSRYARVRDKKRPTYQKFLKWLEDNDVQPGTAVMGRKNWLEFAWTCFPQAKVEYDYLINRRELSKEIASKFNGNLVMELTPLRGKELGEFISAFKTEIASNLIDVNTWIKETPQEDINKAIVDTYNYLYK